MSSRNGRFPVGGGDDIVAGAKSRYLCGGDGDLDLTTMSAHQGAVRVNDLDGIIETAVLSQGIEKVLGQVIVLASSEHLLDTALLLNTVDSGVLKEITQLGVLLNDTPDLLQVVLDSVQGLLLGCCSVQGGGIATVNAVKDKGDLMRWIEVFMEQKGGKNGCGKDLLTTRLDVIWLGCLGVYGRSCLPEHPSPLHSR